MKKYKIKYRKLFSNKKHVKMENKPKHLLYYGDVRG